MAEKKLTDLFYDTLKDIYFAEKQILKSLPKMAKAAHSDELKQAFLTHRDETEGQVERESGRRPKLVRPLKAFSRKAKKSSKNIRTA